MSDEERPVHADFNVMTGETVYTPITDKEWSEIKQREQDAILFFKQEEEKAQQLKEAVQNHPDPVVQALAEKLRII